MKTSLILAICAVFVISGCLVGNVEEQRDSDYGYVEGETSTDTEDSTDDPIVVTLPDSQGEGGGTSTDTGAGGSAGTTTSTTTETGVGGAGGATATDTTTDPESEVLLVIEASTIPPVQEVQACTQEVTVLNYRLTAGSHDLEIKQQAFIMAAEEVPSCMIGLNGTHVFTDIKVMKGAVTVNGPLEFSSEYENGATDLLLIGNDAFTIPAYTSVELQVRVDVACSEDAPGDFFDRMYLVQNYLPSYSAVHDIMTDQELMPWQVAQPEFIFNIFKVGQ